MKCMYCEVYPYCRRSTINGGGCDIDGSEDFGWNFGLSRHQDQEDEQDDEDDLFEDDLFLDD